MIKSEVVPRNEVKWGRTKMFYTYIIQSLKDKSFYMGSTSDLKKRLTQHNRGHALYSSTKVPFKLVWYGAFQEKAKSQRFEKYLKSSSGFAFRNKRLI